jgi:hypothetical protein
MQVAQRRDQSNPSSEIHWSCHSERPKGAKNLHQAIVSTLSMKILRRCAPQNDKTRLIIELR